MSHENEFEKRKKKLNELLEKYDQLKDEGRNEEAWKQLVVALECANETLKFLNEQMSQFYRKVNKGFKITEKKKPKKTVKIIVKNMPKSVQ